MIWRYLGKLRPPPLHPLRPLPPFPQYPWPLDVPAPLQKRCSQLLPSALQLQESVLYYYIYICVCVLEDIICVYLYIINYIYILYIYNFVSVFNLFQLLFLLCVGTCDHNCNSTFLAQLIPRLRLFRLRIVHLRLHLVPRSPTAGRKSLDIDASGAFQDVLANFWSRDFC
jgi:hypothetical protein